MYSNPTAINKNLGCTKTENQKYFVLSNSVISYNQKLTSFFLTVSIQTQQ